MLNMTKVKLELISDADMYLFQKGMGGTLFVRGTKIRKQNMS